MQPWLVIVNYNGWEDTIKCLHSVEPLISQCQTVLVDNASNDDRCDEMRKQFPWCHVVREAENGGWAGGNNAGLKYALERDAQWVVLLNNDTTVDAGIINQLQQAIRENPEYGIIGPVINHMHQPDAVMTDGCRFNRPGYPGFFQRLEVPVDAQVPLQMTEVDIVNGCCLAVSRAVCEKIGLVDESFFLIHEESDFCLRAREAGYKCGVFNRSLVLHKGSSSFKRTGQRTQRYYDSRNLRLLLRKHLGKHREGRGTLSSYRHYFNYLYYRYDLERENGSHEAASAVLDGFYDGLTGRFGPYLVKRRRWGISILKCIFEFRRAVTGWLSPSVKESPSSATALR